MSPSTGNLSSIADQLLRQFDVDRDGKLSAGEFGTLLTRLLGGLSGTVQNATTAAAATAPATTVQPFQPTSSRYVFAGFAPQNHLGETPTIITPKYAVYNVLAEISNDPSFDSKNFASQAAARLQQMFGNPMWTDGQPVFRALDGETLAYGDEYVHYAPAGYGLPAGAYNPEAPGEFFWGYTTT